MFTEGQFKKDLKRKVLRKPPPEFVQGNKSFAERVIDEGELNANTRQWFVECEKQVAFYSDRLGHDLGWLLEWTKQWWWSWLVRDMDVVRQLCAEDVVYKDPASFGRPIVGIQAFIDYNEAFFDAIPDWRYDPLPGESFISVHPDGSAQMMVRYVGTGHWDKPLRVYPFDKDALAIPATGAFMQCPAVDRYHFDGGGRLNKGETLWDGFEAMQMSGVLPSADGLPFRALLAAAQAPALATRLSRRRAA